MICIINGNDIYIRTKEWTADEDFVWKCNKVTVFGNNEYFNIDKAYTCPKDCAARDISGLKLWKESQDDICPVGTKRTDMGGNHAYDCVDAVTSRAHGKTEEDIGSVWMDRVGQTYCLVKIPDENTLWFVMFHDGNMSDGLMCCGKPEGIMRHNKGATHTEDIVIDNRRGTQLWSCFNHYTLKFFIDGAETDISADHVFYGEKFNFVTEYDIIYVPAMLQYLMDNVGHNTNQSQCSDEISERYIRMHVNYEFRRNGSTSVYTKHAFDRTLELDYIGLVQSIAFDEPTYTYVPDTAYDVPVLQEDNRVQKFGRDTWNSDVKAPYRYYQFTDASRLKGMALVYDREIGWGKNGERLKRLEHAGCYSKVRKMYPAFISGGAVAAGQSFDGLAARMPLYRYDEDLTAVCWYWVGNDIVLMVDTHSTVDKDIILPEYMNYKRIEVLDKTDNCQFTQSAIDRKSVV